MAMPQYSNSRFSRILGGRNLIVLFAIAVAFYSLHIYRQNDPLPVSAKAPNIEFLTVDNQKFNLYDVKMPVVLVFYAEKRWFANNIYPMVYEKQMPALKLLAQDGLAQVIIVVADKDTPEKLKEMISSKDYFYLDNIAFIPHNIDETAKSFGVRSWPHAFILDSNHIIRHEAKFLSADAFRKIIKTL